MADPKPGDFLYPGDVIRNLSNHKNLILKGPGLQTHNEGKALLVTRAGIFKFRSPNIYWLDNLQKRYYPKKNDLVVGIVVKKAGDTFKVDIGSSEHASLSALSFEGATKKQKPDLQVGDAVYARLLNAYREMEPELTCVDPYFKAGRLGPLSNEGFIIKLSLNFVSTLLDAKCPLLRTIGKKYMYEVAVGLNGKVWINASTPSDTMSIVNALMSAESMAESKLTEVCNKF